MESGPSWSAAGQSGPGPCPLCGNFGYKPIYSQRKALVAQCRTCGLVRTVDHLFGPGLKNLYDADYALAQPFDPQGRYRKILERPLNLALEYAPPPARFLEIGVGQGWILNKAREVGYRVTGVDLSEPGAEQVHKNSGMQVLVGELAELDLPGSHWDLALIRHTLEHVPEPLEFLREIHRIMVPGGYLVGAVPNFGSLKRRLDGPDWFFLTLPLHRFHYTPKTLSGILAKSGFETVLTYTGEHMAGRRALFQTGLNKVRRLAGRKPAPVDYDPAEVKVDSPVTWVLAQEFLLHQALARFGWGEELVFAARKQGS